MSERAGRDSEGRRDLAALFITFVNAAWTVTPLDAANKPPPSIDAFDQFGAGQDDEWAHARRERLKRVIPRWGKSGASLELEERDQNERSASIQSLVFEQASLTVDDGEGDAAATMAGDREGWTENLILQGAPPSFLPSSAHSLNVRGKERRVQR